MNARKKVVQGSTSAGKTYGIVPILIDKACKIPRLRITIVAETIPAVKDGPVRIFKNVMHDTGRWVDERWLGNPLQYTFANGSVIEFRAFDSVGKAKVADKRDILYMVECNNITYEIASALMIRSKEVWMCFNPEAEFWAHTEVLTEPNSELLLLTYLDNEACPAETIEDLTIKLHKAYYDPEGDADDPKNIKSAYWANWCKVYIFGQLGILQGVVYDNWAQVPDLPKDKNGKVLATLIASGLDFGFVKPAAMLDVYMYNGELYLDERIYKTGLTNAALVDEFKRLGVSKYTCIVADSAEPKSITELENAGYYIEAADKGEDSIRAGIKILQHYKMNVTQRSLNLIKELRRYKWAKKKSGEDLEVPVKFLDHLLDALRYVALNKLEIFAASGEYALTGGDDQADNYIPLIPDDQAEENNGRYSFADDD